MQGARCFSDESLAKLRETCQQEPELAALYAFDLRPRHDCNLAALFAEPLSWPRRLELELSVAAALGLEGVELVNLRRLPLVARYDVLNRGEPLHVGLPEVLAMFIEETVVRYSAFYPLLEALYWQVETKPLAEDML